MFVIEFNMFHELQYNCNKHETKCKLPKLVSVQNSIQVDNYDNVNLKLHNSIKHKM